MWYTDHPSPRHTVWQGWPRWCTYSACIIVLGERCHGSDVQIKGVSVQSPDRKAVVSTATSEPWLPRSPFTHLELVCISELIATGFCTMQFSWVSQITFTIVTNYRARQVKLDQFVPSGAENKRGFVGEVTGQCSIWLNRDAYVPIFTVSRYPNVRTLSPQFTPSDYAAITPAGRPCPAPYGCSSG